MAVVTTYGFNFQASSNGADTGTAGNSLSWLTTVNGVPITVTATAWNATKITSGNNSGKYLITQAWLGQYQGGLGVTSAANDDLSVSGCGVGECNTHQIDNFGNTANSSSIDFVRLSFSSAITLGGLTQYAYESYGAGLNGSIVNDDDFTYGSGGTVSNNLVVSSLSSFLTNNVGSNGECSANSSGYCVDTTTLSSAAQATATTASKDWYIAASIGTNYGGDGIVDAFKVASVTAYSASVPEPQSWAMMVAGFGVIGGTMRRSRKPLPGSDPAVD